MATVKVDINNFQAEVLESAEPVVVDFWAEWCGPCKMIAPSLEELAVEFEGKVKVAKLNIDENPELAAQFGVRSIPTLAMFKAGEVADIKVGAARRPLFRAGFRAPPNQASHI
jgi:thioredoxin 1